MLLELLLLSLCTEGSLLLLSLGTESSLLLLSLGIVECSNITGSHKIESDFATDSNDQGVEVGMSKTFKYSTSSGIIIITLILLKNGANIVFE